MFVFTKSSFRAVNLGQRFIGELQRVQEHPKNLGKFHYEYAISGTRIYNFFS